MSGLIQLLNNTGIPQDIVIKATFYTIACGTLLFAALVVMSRNIFHSAIYLALTLIGIACVYLYLDAEFLAIVQILIYVGAIVTLFIFTIMLTAQGDTGSMREMIRRIWIPALASLAIFFILIKVTARAAWHAVGQETAPLGLPQLGKLLMSKYVLPFEVISLISLAALVGAIVIGRQGKR
ncbi:MAG: NADH-quinone oxidoreductase subunit J [Candidatus Omnitrophota bacterium]|nr:NADH-quinone oxidoreductase subunit J [Candidatus Omnitrophota bacterium]